MATVRPMHAHAIDNLRYIRETMERAGSFTAVPGLGITVMGASAIAAAWIAASRRTVESWLAAWIAEAVLACVIGVASARRKSRAADVPLLSGPGRKFMLGLFPAIVAGAVLTAVAPLAIIPGLWLLLYGTGVVAGGASSVKVVPVMGFCFMALGAAALFAPLAWGNVLLAIGFGGIHVAFGIWITVKYGG